jgi:hypothetical protein
MLWCRSILLTSIWLLAACSGSLSNENESENASENESASLSVIQNTPNEIVLEYVLGNSNTQVVQNNFAIANRGAYSFEVLEEQSEDQNLGETHKNSFGPAFSLGTPFVMRDVRGINVRFNPYQ